MEGLQQLLAGVGEPLAEGGGLGGHVVAAAGHDQVGVLGGQLGQAGQRRHHPAPHQDQRGADLELLDVLGEVPGGHALVDVLVAGEGGELLDAGLHVVAGDPLAGLDRLEVDLVDHLLVGLDGLRRHVDPELALGLEHGDPEPALEHDLGRRRPQLGHRPLAYRVASTSGMSGFTTGSCSSGGAGGSADARGRTRKERSAWPCRASGRPLVGRTDQIAGDRPRSVKARR